MSNETNPQFTIRIVGREGTGALALLIQDTLQAHGVQCIIENDEPVTPEQKVASIVALRQSAPAVSLSHGPYLGRGTELTAIDVAKLQADLQKLQADFQVPVQSITDAPPVTPVPAEPATQDVAAGTPVIIGSGG